MSTLKDFREFAVKGNVMDLAIGVIIGTSFGKIITSLVNDVIMPTFGIALGRLDFSTLVFTVGESTIKYGQFIQSIVDFVIVAFCIFFAIRQIGRFKKPGPAADPVTKECPLCCTAIPRRAKKCPACTGDLA